MSNKIKEVLRLTYLRYLVFIVVCLCTLYGQSDAQWQKTSLPDTKVNALKIVDTSIYACTNGQGIFVSTDNGENWKEINEGLQSKIVHSILINGTTIFAGTESGVSVSTNSGLNWETINSGLSGKGVWSFEADSTCDTIFIGTSSGVYYSIDKGKNWIATSLSYTEMPVHSIVRNGNYIFATTFASGLFKSQDNGLTWQDNTIKYYDERNNIEIVAHVYALAKIDTFITAASISGNIYFTLYNHSGFGCLRTGETYKLDYPILCFASRNDTLFASNSTGYFFVSTEPDKYWGIIYLPLKWQAMYSLALNSSYIFAGTEKGAWRLWYPETITGVDNIKENPSGFSLEQNYPNPFNPETTIKYSIPKIETNEYLPVQLKVYSLLGQEIATLVNEIQPAGHYSISWNAMSSKNNSSGVYILYLRAGSFVKNIKMLLLK